ncbi:hypothetical protein RXP12_29035, partial [Pseudomonas aeruginosa]|nr:hypothetical protein [Pseudomonas aeruginosa]
LEAATGVEATSLFTGAQKAARKTVNLTAAQIAKEGLKSGLAEAGGEAIQEGAQQRAENLALGRPEWEGVGASSALGGIVGAVSGSSIGSISAIGDNQQENQNVSKRVRAAKEDIAGLKQSLESQGVR